MPFVPFERLVTGDPVMEQLQDRLEQAFANNLAGSPVDGEGISVSLAGLSEVRVNHRLGRQPTGWTITDAQDLSGAPNIYRVSWDDRTIVLSNPDALTGTIVVRVF